MIRKPRGTMDILPDEVAYWQFIEKTARKTAALYGFGEIRFPTFEATELFRRGVGDTTDVVQKEMYTFEDREGRSLTLRPEGTACVARALTENGKCSDTMPIKLYYIANFFRYEKPQAGRSREFVQFGTEMYGASDPAADASVISLADAVIRELGIKDAKLYINSIGCPHCRPEYHAALKAYFEKNEDKLCPTCRDRLKTNPLRILDCKNPECKELAADAPRTIDHLCPECKDHFEKLKADLDAMGIEYEIDPKIVRGLDYYTRTVFEFIVPTIGAQSTICGGGRYDGLMKEIGGTELPGIGFGMGITRLILAMKSQGIVIEPENKPRLYVASMGDEASERALGIVRKLRSEGIYAECDLCRRSLKAQMKYADKIGAAYVLIIGSEELQTGSAKLRDMSGAADQIDVDINDTEKLRDIVK